jgi:phosphoglycerol transferase MdoB-like AlkP superfamily enzyme
MFTENRVSQLIPKRVVTLCLLLAPVLVIYQALRALFYLFQYSTFSQLPPGEILYSFLHGTRFDVVAISWVSLPWVLIWVLAPYRWLEKRKLRVSFFATFFLTHCFFMSFNIADFKFFSFSGKRLTADIFHLAGDIGNVGFELVTYYWVSVSSGVLLFVVLGGVLIRIKNEIEQTLKAGWGETGAQRIFATVIVVAVVFLGLRGGWQLKPIRPVHAFSGVSAEGGALVLNSTFTLLRSKGTSLRKFNFFPNLEEARAHLIAEQSPPEAHFGLMKDANVVLIILESFSLEYTGLVPEDGPSYTPFLKALAEKKRSRVFTYHFANGRRSIDAVPSLIVGIPALMSVPFVSSAYQTNRVGGWGEALKMQGYNTAFFHGAKNGSMFFDSFAAQAGFSDYFGKNEFPTAREHDDGSWGIFDEPFFLFAAETLSKKENPFAAVLFSLSSHHPYPIPEKHKNQFPKGTLEIHEVIGYTDHALAQFFEYAKTQKWYKNTLFVLTSDHTSITENAHYQTPTGAYRVPLLIYAPGVDLPTVPAKSLSQHVDVPKTILTLLGADSTNQLQFGRDVFSQKSSGEVYNFAYPGFWYLNGSGLFRFDDEGQLLSFESTAEGPGEGPSKDAAVLRMHAWLQYFVNGLIENRWLRSVN